MKLKCCVCEGKYDREEMYAIERSNKVKYMCQVCGMTTRQVLTAGKITKLSKDIEKLFDMMDSTNRQMSEIYTRVYHLEETLKFD